MARTVNVAQILHDVRQSAGLRRTNRHFFHVALREPCLGTSHTAQGRTVVTRALPADTSRNSVCFRCD
jgi:hypothetical protein